MKKGDVVTIQDGSYSRSVIDGKLVHEHLALGDEKSRQYIVIEVECSFPLERNRICDQPNNYRNDTVIQALDGGKVVFIHESFLELVLPKHKVMIDLKSTRCAVLESGLVVEISDKLYQEIKRGSQS